MEFAQSAERITQIGMITLRIIVFFLLTTSLYGQDAMEIVNRYLDTVSNGDIVNWRNIRSTYTESEVYYSQNDFDQRVNLLRPDKPSFHKSFRDVSLGEKSEIYADSTFTELQSSFYFLKDKTIIVLGNIPPIIKKTVGRNESFPEHLPLQVWEWMQASKSVELLGVKEFPLDGIHCYEIRMSTRRRNYMLYINTETFLLDYMNGREDGDMSFLVKLSNYTRVGDLLIPFSDSMMRNGVTYYWRHIRRIELNAEIDSEIFKYREDDQR